MTGLSVSFAIGQGDYFIFFFLRHSIENCSIACLISTRTVAGGVKVRGNFADKRFGVLSLKLHALF